MALPYYVKKRITDIIISIIMLLFLVLTLLPVGWMVFSSLKSSSDIAIGRVGLSRNVAGQVEVHWDNYVDMWKNVNFGLYLKNSLIICGSTMILAMILSTLAAYALSRFKFPGSDFFSNTILATQMIPAIMYLIPLYIMFVKFTVMTGIPVKGTYLGLILIYSAFFVPFSIWILRGFFASIPKELEEAARIDGCSALQVFWYIAPGLGRADVRLGPDQRRHHDDPGRHPALRRQLPEPVRPDDGGGDCCHHSGRRVILHAAKTHRPRFDRRRGQGIGGI
jgi:multiple sugar transport system permease protein